MLQYMHNFGDPITYAEVKLFVISLGIVNVFRERIQSWAIHYLKLYKPHSS